MSSGVEPSRTDLTLSLPRREGKLFILRVKRSIASRRPTKFSAFDRQNVCTLSACQIPTVSQRNICTEFYLPNIAHPALKAEVDVTWEPIGDRLYCRIPAEVRARTEQAAAADAGVLKSWLACALGHNRLYGTFDIKQTAGIIVWTEGSLNWGITRAATL
jgi:hypothetical protein